MNKKYIIYDNELRMGHVDYHKELFSKLRGDESKVKGGGWWHMNREKGVIYLYSSSEDFGKAQLEDVKRAIETGYLKGFDKLFKYAYSTSDSLGEAMENHILLERIEES